MAQTQTHFPDGIPNHYVLLDSDSTVSIFNNAAMLVDIHEVYTPLVLESNGGGHQLTHQMGTIPGFGKVWYNEDSIANILSLADVRKAQRVTMDTSDDAAFHVHKPDLCVLECRDFRCQFRWRGSNRVVEPSAVAFQNCQ
jgi:hypothetical protein